jgi:N6-adenosine-specific RNA methylase IME4
MMWRVMVIIETILELFARRRRQGWDAFGNEIQGSITMPNL